MSMSASICISAEALSMFIGHVEKAFAIPPVKNNAKHVASSSAVFIVPTSLIINYSLLIQTSMAGV